MKPRSQLYYNTAPIMGDIIKRGSSLILDFHGATLLPLRRFGDKHIALHYLYVRSKGECVF
jgi:hypothetical protein